MTTTQAPALTRSQMFALILTAVVESKLPDPHSLAFHVPDAHTGRSPFLFLYVSSVDEGKQWAEWHGSAVLDESLTHPEWVGRRGGWNWYIVANGPTAEQVAAALLAPDVEPIPAGVDGVRIGGRA